MHSIFKMLHITASTCCSAAVGREKQNPGNGMSYITTFFSNTFDYDDDAVPSPIGHSYVNDEKSLFYRCLQILEN